MHTRQNILLITADQWRGDCLGVMGHPVVRTPHMDALARDGTLFRRHYAGAAPCGPARACLYTGLYQMNNRVVRNGTPLDHRFDNIARAARRCGYDPTLFGYTDVTADPRTLHENDPLLTSYEGVLPGFTARQLLPEHETPWQTWLKSRGHAIDRRRNIHLPDGTSGGSISNAPTRYGRDETQTAFLTDCFLDWFDEQPDDKPWFAHVSFLRPHPPFVAPEPFNRMYDAGDGPAYVRHATREAEAALHPYLAYRFESQNKSDYYPDAEGRVRDWTANDFDQLRATYYGMITEVDGQLGRIFSKLKNASVWDNTIVVVTSDHGEMMGDHWSLGKSGFFDASFHIPLIIRAPVAAVLNTEHIVDAFTEASDLFPTLLDLMRTQPTNGLDGRSLLPFLRGQSIAGWRDAAHWEYDFRDIAEHRTERHFDLASNQCNMSVYRDSDFKYVHFAGLPPLLFDLTTDPGELHNVAHHPQYLDARLNCCEKMLAWRAAHFDQTLANLEVTTTGLEAAAYLDVTTLQGPDPNPETHGMDLTISC